MVAIYSYKPISIACTSVMPAPTVAPLPCICHISAITWFFSHIRIQFTVKTFTSRYITWSISIKKPKKRTVHLLSITLTRTCLWRPLSRILYSSSCHQLMGIQSGTFSKRRLTTITFIRFYSRNYIVIKIFI